MLRSPRIWSASAQQALRCIVRTETRPTARFAAPVRRQPLGRSVIRQFHQQQSRRQEQSTAGAVAASTASYGSKIIAYIYGTAFVFVLGFGYLYITDTRASIHQWLVVPALRLIHYDPEEAHHSGIRYISALHDFNLHPRERGNEDEEKGDLRVEVFGHVLNNPVGTSAGIDKNAEIPSALFALGPAIVEVGGVTPLPQEGNPKPRVFRIPSQNALINRYGLNSEGAEHVAMQLRERLRSFAYSHGLGIGPEAEEVVLSGDAQVPPGSLVPGKLLAVQIAKNKATPDNDILAIARDYVTCVDHLAKYADILVVNVSSPNTPGLRDLQATGPLTAILTAVVDAAQDCDRKTKPAVMVKVSPDEDSDAQIEGICAAVWASGVDGVIVGNTTKKRPAPVPQGYIMPADEAKILTEIGGYSGPQMFERTLDLVKRYREKLDLGPPEDEQTSSRSSSSPQKVSSQLEQSQLQQQTARDPSPQDTTASIKRDTQNLKPLDAETSEAEKSATQPLIRLPARHKSDSSPNSSSSTSSSSFSSSSSSEPLKAKVLFATGGITNGEQCLQILNAGASVCQVYTAMMYGGVGTVTRIKSEMRNVMSRGREERENKALEQKLRSGTATPAAAKAAREPAYGAEAAGIVGAKDRK
jgi:dihydroorotate dehydrogenase